MKTSENQLNEKEIFDYMGGIAPIVVLDSVPSTNDEAKRLAENGAKEGATVVANAQTQGRGRRGRSFFSPADSGVYFSVVLRPSITPEKSVLITTAAALAVSEAIEKLTGKRALIKWLNDVYLNGKKCVGILTEGVFSGSAMESVVVGIGINVSTVSFPDDVKQRAGSIGETSRNALVGETVKRLLRYCSDLSPRHIEKYKERCFVLGQTVTVSHGNEKYDALAVDVTAEGKLVVKFGDEVKELYGEEVSLIVK